MSVENPETEIIDVKGQHKMDRSNEDVAVVCIENSSLQHFPRHLEKIFPNMTKLTIDKCGLETISREDLKGLENLEKLIISENKIKKLPNDLFEDMKKLETVSFYGNELESMSSKLLEPIKGSLWCVNFVKNKKIDVVFRDLNAKDSLQLKHLMEIIDNSCNAPEGPARQKHNEETMMEIEALWNSQFLSDFTIIAGSKKFLVHKFVLAIHSSVFDTIFKTNMKECNEGKMEIKEFSEEAIEDFLRFFYTAEISSDENAMELFMLADKYDVHHLKTVAEEMISRNVDEQNVLEVYLFGKFYNLAKVKKSSIEVVDKMPTPKNPKKKEIDEEEKRPCVQSLQESFSRIEMPRDPFCMTKFEEQQSR
jgi:BTB/POZ domain/Leucine rich repeat